MVRVVVQEELQDRHHLDIPELQEEPEVPTDRHQE
jgi:hypothetical protein